MRSVSSDIVTLPPLNTSAEGQTIWDCIEQVIAKCKIVFAGAVHSKHVALEHSLQAIS